MSSCLIGCGQGLRSHAASFPLPLCNRLVSKDSTTSPLPPTCLPSMPPLHVPHFANFTLAYTCTLHHSSRASIFERLQDRPGGKVSQKMFVAWSRSSPDNVHTCLRSALRADVVSDHRSFPVSTRQLYQSRGWLSVKL